MKRLPIRIAREVARENGLRQVILCAWDGERTHVVTYGVSVEDCAQAAIGGNKIKGFLGWPKNLNAEPSRVKALHSKIEELEYTIERYVEMTRKLDEHPDGFDDYCECATCLSYADDADTA